MFTKESMRIQLEILKSSELTKNKKRPRALFFYRNREEKHFVFFTWPYIFRAVKFTPPLPLPSPHLDYDPWIAWAAEYAHFWWCGI